MANRYLNSQSYGYGFIFASHWMAKQKRNAVLKKEKLMDMKNIYQQKVIIFRLGIDSCGALV